MSCIFSMFHMAKSLSKLFRKKKKNYHQSRINHNSNVYNHLKNTRFLCTTGMLITPMKQKNFCTKRFFQPVLDKFQLMTCCRKQVQHSVSRMPQWLCTYFNTTTIFKFVVTRPRRDDLFSLWKKKYMYHTIRIAGSNTNSTSSNLKWKRSLKTSVSSKKQMRTSIRRQFWCSEWSSYSEYCAPRNHCVFFYRSLHLCICFWEISRVV